jgi:hypothetical protein
MSTVSIPTRSDFEVALASVQLTVAEQDLLDTFLSRPNATATATELADALGFSSYGVANSAVGRLGRELAAAIPSLVVCRRRDGSPEWWTVVAAGGRRASDGHFEWVLHRELCAALGRSRPDALEPDLRHP